MDVTVFQPFTVTYVGEQSTTEFYAYWTILIMLLALFRSIPYFILLTFWQYFRERVILRGSPMYLYCSLRNSTPESGQKIPIEYAPWRLYGTNCSLPPSEFFKFLLLSNSPGFFYILRFLPQTLVGNICNVKYPWRAFDKHREKMDPSCMFITRSWFSRDVTITVFWIPLMEEKRFKVQKLTLVPGRSVEFGFDGEYQWTVKVL